jgi:hypothetical protein
MSFLDDLIKPGTIRIRRSAGLDFAAYFLGFLVVAGLTALNQSPELGIVLLALLDIAVIVSLISGLERNLATWLLALFINGALITKSAKMISSDAALSSTSQAIGPTLKRREWIAARRATPVSIAEGEALMKSIDECVTRYHDNFDRYPSNAGQLDLVNCQQFLGSQADTAAVLKRFPASDHGWRWTYTPSAADSLGHVTRYRVRVFEDPAIDRPSPQYSSDETTGG